MRPLATTLPALLVALALAGPVRAEEAALGSSGDESLVPGHNVRLLTTGRASFNARDRNIAEADIVFYKTYAFLDDETGRETVASLVAQARAGAQVFVAYDVKGTTHSVPRLIGMALGMHSEIPAHLRPLVEAGVVLIPTNKPTLRSLFLGRDHDKALLTWKRGQPARVIMGGMNVGDSYRWSGPWTSRRVPTLAYRDTDVEVSGPETARVAMRFREAASHLKGPALAALRKATLEILSSPSAQATGTQRVAARFIRNNPKDGKDRRSIERLYEQLIRETPDGETITLSNAYILPTKRLLDAILTATARGVRFKLLVNPPDAPQREARLVALAFRDQLRTLLRKAPEGSIEVDEFHGNARRNEGAIHQKIAKFGAHGPVLVGSANLDPLSANHNSETVLVVQHPSLVRQFDALMGRAMREGKIRRLDREVLKRDSFGVKAKGFFLNRVVGRFL